ncbi:F-box associated interaction domain [Arabidopsis suecica]|uniref:F-box associated interaction domain n=1 Tax=Arabidopsis suecica TaxID=45249 RepID=A0A8T2B7A2_ARASU|nr:F-box associated interaction domain [Arabidopsis suecica]
MDLVGEILSRVPLTSLSAVRCTCKSWNALSKHQIFGKAEVSARKQFLGLMVMDSKVCSLRFGLQGIRNDGDDKTVVPTSIKQVSVLDQVEISQVFHCDGLLLCVTKDRWRLVVWNPYLGQFRWIRFRKQFGKYDMFTLGYDNNNRNHKIMRFIDKCGYSYPERRYLEVHDVNSNSWRVVEFNPIWNLCCYYVSLKGNTYFFAQDIIQDQEEEEDLKYENYILCFDFTAERFGPQLPLPFHSYDDEGGAVTLSCVREEQLALLYQSFETRELLEIWISNKIDPNLVSWSKFLKLDITTLTGFPKDFRCGSFFIDDEKKVSVVSDPHKYILFRKPCPYYKVYIIGEDGYFKSFKIKSSKSPELSSYAPSLVQLQTNKPCKRKRRSNKPKRERKNKRRMIEITN